MSGRLITSSTIHLATEKMIHVAKQVLIKLEDLDSEQTALPWTFKPELQKLKHAVSTVHAVHHKQVNDRSVGPWREKLSGLVYEADDLVDDLYTEARVDDDGNRRRTTTCWSAVCFLVISFPRRLLYGVKMGRSIKAIREQLDGVLSEHEEMDILEDLEGQPAVPLPADFRPDEIVIGSEDDKQNIIEKLLSSDCEAVAVVGMRGAGKTSLIKLILRDPAIALFEVRVWIHVAGNLDIRGILEEMLQSVTRGSRHGGLQLDDLKDMLQQEVSGKRFLLVLDDAWDEGAERWESLGEHLTAVGGAAGSKVLVTTRKMEVAEMASRGMKGRDMAAAEPYQLAGMTDDRCWHFFKEKVFHGTEPGSPMVEAIARDMARLCYGIPLLIHMAARLLSFKDPETEWLSVLQELRSHADGPDRPDMFSAITLTCYNHLPSHQKLCFSYCILFPRGHEFDVQSLVQLWAAQGYGDEGLSGYKQGLQCFKMLWWRSFFNDVEVDEFGNLTTCKIHDLMHDVARAVSEKEIRYLAPGENECIGEKVRHLRLAAGSEALSRWFPANVVEPRSLRTLLLDTRDSSGSSRTTCSRQKWSVLKRVSASCKRLRALDAHSFGIKQVPSSIRNLTSLRYLDVSGNDAMERLPESITELWNLQTLKLSGCRRLKQLPSSIRKLVNLQHLYCEGCWNLTHMPLGIGELSSLLTLTCFVLPKDSSATKDIAAGLSELGSLKRLRGRLEIRNLGAHSGGSGTSFLREMPDLDSLSLCWDMDDGASADVQQQHEQALECCEPPSGLKELELSEYGGENFPSWLSSLKNLIRIKILHCARCRSLPPLEEFPLLRFCTIDSLPRLEYIGSWSERKHGSSLFPYLKELYLWNCPSLKAWWEAAADATLPAFHCLSRLEIRDCPKLDRTPRFPTLDEKLLLEYSSLAPLQQTMQGQEEVLSLKSLWILSVAELQVLPEQWLQKLSSLEELLIEFCPRLAFLPRGMRRLTSLRVLDIYRCPQLSQRCGSNKAVDWSNIAHIPNVRIAKKLVQLGGRYLLSEKESIAAIANFSLVHPLSKMTSVTLENLESLPAEWVQNLSTLKELKIINCPSIRSWPEELRSVALLERLQINGCPALEKRCIVDDDEEDCTAIAHVPFVQAGDRVVRPKPC